MDVKKNIIGFIKDYNLNQKSNLIFKTLKIDLIYPI